MSVRAFQIALIVTLTLGSVSCRSAQDGPEQVVEGDLRFTLVPIGGFPQFLRAADGFIWGMGGRPQFWKIDQATNEVSPVPIRWQQRDEIADFVVGHGSIWISTYPPLGAGQRTRRFDAVTGELQGAIEFGGSLAVGEGALWTFDHRSGVVRRIDPTSSAVVRAISVRPRPRRLLAVGGDLWLLGVDDGVLTHIDGATNTIAWERPAGEPHESNIWRFFVGGDSGFYSGLHVAEDIAWVTDQRSTSRLFAFEQPVGTIARVERGIEHAPNAKPVGRWPMSPVEFAGAIWITVVNDRERTSVARIDPHNGSVLAMHELPRHRLFFPDSAQTMVAGDNALWIGADGVLQKVEVGNDE